MKPQSLLSVQSNLSQLSNVSYHGQKKQYKGSQFFKQSLPPGCDYKIGLCNELRQQQIQLQSLEPGFFKTFTNVKEHISAFTPYWITQPRENMEQGLSENQNEDQQQIIEVKKQQNFKIQELQQKISYLKQPDVQSPILSQIQKQQHSENDRNQQKGIKNQTKNIPKNYGKAIIIFIQNNRDVLEKIVISNGDSYDHLLTKLRNLKKKINTISDLRNIWNSFPQSKSLRILSNTFLRKYSLHYIYNSRIKTRMCHAKYKNRLLEAIVNPKQFNHIKDY